MRFPWTRAWSPEYTVPVSLPVVQKADGRFYARLADMPVPAEIDWPPEPAGSDARCPICERVIVHEAHGGPHPSPGDHDPGLHVARAYGTQP